MRERDGTILSVGLACVVIALAVLAFSWPTENRDGWVAVDTINPPATASAAARPVIDGHVAYADHPTLRVNVVGKHARPPATVREEAEWLDRREMVSLEPGTRVRVTGDRTPDGRLPIEVRQGEHEGYRGWVWHDVFHPEDNEAAS